MSVQLHCFDHEDNEPEQVERCEWDSEVPTKYCVFKRQKENDFTKNISIDRGCADDDDIGLKNFYKDLMGANGLSDTGCIICRELEGCKNGGLGELDMDDMVCFCKTNKCNQCDYKRTPCQQIEFKPRQSNGWTIKMEVCEEVNKLCSYEMEQSTSKYMPSNSKTTLITKNDSEAGASSLSNGDQRSITTPLTLSLILIPIAAF